jgi:prefoldin subunit 5
MNKFDKVIESLQETIAEIDEEWDCVQPQGLKAKQEYDNLIEQYKQAIATLESYPK